MVAFMITLWTVAMVWGLAAHWVIQHNPSKEKLEAAAYVLVWCGMICTFSGTLLLVVGVWHLAVSLGF